MRRAVAVLAVVIGLGLIVVPLAYSLYDRTTDAERVLDRFEFLTLAGNPARYLSEAETTRRGSAELVNRAIPTLASGAGISDGEFNRLADARFPALTAAREAVPRANEFSVRYSRQLDAVDGKFRSVYDIPADGVSLAVIPWLFTLAGLVSLASGLAVLGTSRLAPMIVLLVLGAGLVLGPLALGAPGKSADGEDVKDFASNGLSARAATAAHNASAALDALVKETQVRTLPHIARRERVSQSQLDRELARDFPAAAKFLDDWKVIGPRLSRLATAVAESVDDFESAKKMPISFSVWLLLGAGLMLSAAAGSALLWERR